MTQPDSREPVVMAMVVCGLLIAQQVAGKAARDALFLTSFPVAWLPAAMMISALVSLVAVAVLSRAMARRSPFQVVPVMAAVASLLLLVEWSLGFWSPRAAAAAVYLHLAFFGATLISGFWSLFNERFDPYTAKAVVNRITMGGTIGGVAGGALAFAAARVVPVPAMLLVMAVLSMAAVAGMARLRAGHPGAPAPQDDLDPIQASALATLKRVPYLRDLALLVTFGAVTDTLLDYGLKSQAAAAFSKGAHLLSFFAVLNGLLALLGLLAQTWLVGPSLRGLGLAGTVAVRPLTVAVAAAIGLVDPRLWSVVLARGFQDVNASSLFRSGYELLFTPLPEGEKRPTKAVIDVGFDKLGSLLGGAVALLVATLAPSVALRCLFGLAVLLCAAALAMTGRLHRGYVSALENSLRAGSVQLQAEDLLDDASRLTLARTSLALDRETLLRQIAALREKDEPVTATREDPLLRMIAELRSPDAARIRAVLRAGPGLDPALVPHLVPLLARDDLSQDALKALRALAPRVTGQLIDSLLDPAQPASVRRRLPRVLKACATQRSADGLVLGLADEVLVVRSRCAQALAAVQGRNAEVQIPRDTILGSVSRELASDDAPLDHVFTLLSLIVEREGLRVAYSALRGTDRALRGTALEYLENVLPDAIRRALWPRLGEPVRATRAREFEKERS